MRIPPRNEGERIFWEDLSPEDQEAELTRVHAELALLEEVEYPAEAYLGDDREMVVVLGPINRFESTGDKRPGAGGQLVVEGEDGSRFVALASSIYANPDDELPLVVPIPDRKAWKRRRRSAK